MLTKMASLGVKTYSKAMAIVFIVLVVLLTLVCRRA